MLVFLKFLTKQKAHVQKVEHALQFAETTMLKSQAEVEEKRIAIKEINKFVYSAETVK